MGRSPCCSNLGLNRGTWTTLEDKILTSYIRTHGEGKWRNLPKRAGLKRCGKSCRLRWLNYLRPDIKRGNISHDEEELIIRLHNLLGNRWSLIAGRLPGRADNEIKNYWNTNLGKRVRAQSSSPSSNQSPTRKSIGVKNPATEPSATPTRSEPIRTKAFRCTKSLLPTLPPLMNPDSTNSAAPMQTLELQENQTQLLNYQCMDDLKMDYGTEELHAAYTRDANFYNFGCGELQASDGDANGNSSYNINFSMVSDHSLQFDEPWLEGWMSNNCLEDNDTSDLGSLAFLLDSEERP